MVNIAICDDEEIMLYKLKDKIYQLFQHDCKLEVDLFDNSKKFIDSFAEKLYDLIFLDINMPEHNGFEVAEILRNHKNKINIVFITSINDYAFDAYLYNPIGFIRKDNIDDDLKKYKKSILNILINNNAHYTYTLNSEINKIKISDICYFDTSKNYLNIHTLDDGIIKIKKPLKSVFEEIKSDMFIQINKGIIVNIEHINKIDKHFAYTITNEILSISGTFSEDFKNKFKKDM